MNTERSDVDGVFGSWRGESWSDEAHREALGRRLAAAGRGDRAGHGRVRAAAVAGGMLALAVGVAAAVKVYRAYAWEAQVTVRDREVDLYVNGQKVAPDQVVWLADGNVLVTVNGATVLMDPNQPGGASASIRIEPEEPSGE